MNAVQKSRKSQEQGVPIVFSFFARMNLKNISKKFEKWKRCLLFSVFSRGWTSISMRSITRSKVPIVFSFFARMNITYLTEFVKYVRVPIVFSFFARMNTRAVSGMSARYWCLLFSVFSRGWTSILNIRFKQRRSVPIVFSFFARMNDSSTSSKWNRRRGAYCFQFFRADELYGFLFGQVVPNKCLLFSVFSRGWT